jgi:hemerythrin superfamily protein
MGHELFASLRGDHDTVRTILSRFTSCRTIEERKNLIGQLRQELLPHMDGEERAVYPSILDQPETRQDAVRSIQEHREARRLLEAAAGADPAEPGFDTMIEALRRAVEEHVREEEGRLFGDLERMKTEDELGRILDGFLDEKRNTLRSLDQEH